MAYLSAQIYSQGAATQCGLSLNGGTGTHSISGRRLRRHLWIVATSLFPIFLFSSQRLTSQVIPPGAQTGSPVNSSGDQHGIDSVNTENLGLHIDIPLLSIQERGRTYTVTYVYNSPVYTVQFDAYQETEPDGETGNWVVLGPSSGIPNNWNIVTPNMWQLADDTSPATDCITGGNNGGYNYEEYVEHTNYRLVDPEGTEHPLAMLYDAIIGGGTTGTNQYPPCGVLAHNLTSPTLDGTAAEVDLTQNAFWLADGTKYTVDNSDAQYPIVTKIEDRNGNLLDLTGLGPDMMNRSVLKQTVSTQTQDVYQYLDSSGSQQSIIINYVSVPYQTDDCSVVSEWLNPNKCVEGSGTFRLPQNIILPNSQEYSFAYNSGGHAELTSMTLPSGATITYSYQRVQTGSSGRTGTLKGASGYSSAYFHYGISQRTMVDNGVSALWQYTTTDDGSAHPSYTTTVEDPSNNCVVHSYGTVDSQHLYGLGELTTTYESGCGSTAPVLKTITTSYDYDEEAAPDGTLDAYFVRPHIVATTFAAGETSQVQTDYETFTFGGGLTGSWGNPTEIREYDFGASSPTRTTDYSYLDQVGSTTRTAAQYLAAHIVKGVRTETVSSASGAVVKTTYDYDNYGSGVTPSGAYGRDTSYGNWGNVTEKTVTDEVSGQAYNSYYTYEDTGNMLSSTDPRSLTTQYSWADAWSNAACGLPSGQEGHVYLTKITNPLSESTTYTYNSCSGSLAEITDANKQPTQFTYDEMGRTLQITAADSGITKFHYQDSVPLQMTETNEVDAQTSKVLTTTYDGEFRPIETDLTSDTEGMDIVKTQYDLVGRVSSVSNPYRSTSDATYGLTTYTYDALGRKIIQKDPDENSVQWCYDNLAVSSQQTACMANHTAYGDTWVDSLDESGNRSQEVYDGLGSVVAAVEPDPTSNTLAFETDYSYDALGNLLEVNQKGGSGDTPVARTFTYDGFSRLLCASNPENSESACPATESATIPSGVTAYSYDPDSNIHTRIDARGITTTYTYTSLNQIASKTYSDATTPSACFEYGQSTAGNTVGRMIAEWTQPGACASAPPNGALTEREIGSYDPVGRILTDEQCLSVGDCTGALYALSYTYDWDGNVRSFTNGLAGSSALTFNTAFDGADRLSSVTGSPSPGASDLATLYTASEYTPTGALSGASMGTGATPITLTRNYNNRLWPTAETDIAGSTPGTTTVQITGSEQNNELVNTEVVFTGAEASGVTSAYNVMIAAPGGPQNGLKSWTVYATSSDTENSMAAKLVAAIDTNSTGNCSSSPPGTLYTVEPAGGSVDLLNCQEGGTYYFYTAFMDTCSGPSGSCFSITAGGVPNYDTGTVSLAVDNVQIASTTYGEGSTPSSIVSGLISASSGNSLVNLSAGSCSGSTCNLTVTAQDDGTSTDYSYSVNVNDTSNFGGTSFSGSAAAGQLQGGTNVPLYNWAITSYAPNGDITGTTDSLMGTWTYNYDHLNRLATSAGSENGNPFPDECWSYDPFGNRTMQMTANVPFAAGSGGGSTCQTTGSLGLTFWADYDSRNRMTQNSLNTTQAAGYDADGDITDDGRHNYTYDAENRIVGMDSWTYYYDAEGRRVGRSSGGLTTSYLLGLNGEQVTEMGASGWAHSNLYAGGRLLATYEGPAGSEAQGYYFHLTDWLGTERVQVHGDGAVDLQCQSYPFGDGSICQHATEQQFTGKERDPESGNDYFGARYYASSAGRWLMPDPAGRSAANPDFPQTWNMYMYSANNPLIFTDPTGLDCVYYDDSGTKVESIDHHSNSGECGNNGGNWEEGTTFKGWQHYDATSDTWTGASMDGQNVYFYQGAAPGEGSPGDENGNGYAPNCFSNCMFGTSTSISSLMGQLQDGATFYGLLHWAVDQGPSFGTNGVGAAQNDWVGGEGNDWCGAGGAGPPSGNGWGCMAHDYAYVVAGFTKGSNFDTNLPASRAKQLQRINQTLCNNVSGAWGLEITGYFATVGSIAAPCR